MKKEYDERTPTTTPRREINKHEHENKYEREKNRHTHALADAISVIKTDKE